MGPCLAEEQIFLCAQRQEESGWTCICVTHLDGEKLEPDLLHCRCTNSPTYPVCPRVHNSVAAAWNSWGQNASESNSSAEGAKHQQFTAININLPLTGYKEIHFYVTRENHLLVLQNIVDLNQRRQIKCSRGYTHFLPCCCFALFVFKIVHYFWKAMAEAAAVIQPHYIWYGMSPSTQTLRSHCLHRK